VNSGDAAVPIGSFERNQADDALRDALAVEGGLSIVGTAGNAAEAVAVVRAHRPHVTLVDVATPRVSGLKTLRHLTDSGMGVPTVALTDSMASMEAVTALAFGARGILPKNVLPSVRYECVKTVARGAYWIGREQVNDVVEAWQHVRAEQQLDAAEAATMVRLQARFVKTLTDDARTRHSGGGRSGFGSWAGRLLL
jgi:DNA-binding NarL/FixJ family response regulator